MMLKRSESKSGLRTRLLGRAELPGLDAQWQDLASRATEDCVYYAPHYANALLGSVARNDRVRAVTAWDGERLMALLPVTKSGLPVPGLRPAGQAWRTDYTYSCTPLLDRAEPLTAALGLVEALANLAAAEWMIPEVNAEGPAAAAVMAALDLKGHPYRLERSFERASLSAGLSFDAHMQTKVASKRRRELARNRRRLEDIAPLKVETATEGADLERAMRVFLALERSGWKGRQGTALDCAPDTRAFAGTAFGAVTRGARVRIDVLLLGDKPIAAGVIVFSGTTGFTVKGAYDEAYASHSAGLVLEQEVIRSFLTDQWADRLDAATNGSHVIDHLWPDRVKVSDLVFSLARSAPVARLDMLCRVNALGESAKAKIKRHLKR